MSLRRSGNPRQPTATSAARRERAALLLACGWSVKGAASEVGAGERTLHTWLESREFRAQIAGFRFRLCDEAVGKLAGAAGAAADSLRALLDDPSPAVRLRASTAILDATLKARTAFVLRRRELRLKRKLGLPAEQADGASGQQSEQNDLVFDYDRLDKEELRDLESLNLKYKAAVQLTPDEAVRFTDLLRKAMIRPAGADEADRANQT